MKEKSWLIRVVVGVLLFAMAGCDRSPSNPDNGSLLKEGRTSGGRQFNVFGEDIRTAENGETFVGPFTLSIDGEADVVFSNDEGRVDSYYEPDIPVSSIQVYDLPGSPALVYVDWRSSEYAGRTSYSLNHYAIFAQGQATMLLLKGTGFLRAACSRVYHEGEGTYTITYEDNIVSMTETWTGFSGGVYYYDIGTAEEKFVSRTFLIESQSVVPLTCEERLRTTQTNAHERDQLSTVPWTQRVSSPGDDPIFCAAIRPKRCVLDGECLR